MIILQLICREEDMQGSPQAIEEKNSGYGSIVKGRGVEIRNCMRLSGQAV
jgi:hypothetical protein